MTDLSTIYKISCSLPFVNTYVAGCYLFREIFLKPEIRGYDFQNKLSEGLSLCVESILSDKESLLNMKIKDAKCVDVLYILRGGLNFDLHNHFNFKGHYTEVSFCSSQRLIEEGRVFNAEIEYNKLNLHDNSILVIGDIAATGTTIKFHLLKILKTYRDKGMVLKGIILFTIGTSLVVEELSKLLKDFEDNYPFQIPEIDVIFLEAIFDLNLGEISYPEHNLVNTDFFVKNFERTLDFELARLESVNALFERCIIYDGGSRSFEPSFYFDNLVNYWNKLYNNADKISLKSFLRDRTDLFDYTISDESLDEFYLHKNKTQFEELKQMKIETISKIEERGLRSICEEKLDNLLTTIKY